MVEIETTKPEMLISAILTCYSSQQCSVLHFNCHLTITVLSESARDTAEDRRSAGRRSRGHYLTSGLGLVRTLSPEANYLALGSVASSVRPRSTEHGQRGRVALIGR